MYGISGSAAFLQNIATLVCIDNLLLDLSLKIPWIGKMRHRVESLQCLLTEAQAANPVGGPALVECLLKQFVFLSSDDYDQFLLDIALFIVDEFDLDRTLLCATTADSHKDSAQRVLYDLVTVLASLGKYRVRNRNRYDAAAKEKDVDALLLIDEFIGTGQSFLGRAKNVRRLFVQKNLPVPLIHGVALVGMTNGLRSISGEFESLNVCLALKKGIEHYFPLSERENAYSTMRDIEGVLSSEYGGIKMPTMGYGRTESLYSRHGGSCPNNVFPIFWWPQSSSLADRRPLVPRSFSG